MATQVQPPWPSTVRTNVWIADPSNSRAQQSNAPGVFIAKFFKIVR